MNRALPSYTIALPIKPYFKQSTKDESAMNVMTEKRIQVLLLLRQIIELFANEANIHRFTLVAPLDDLDVETVKFINKTADLETNYTVDMYLAPTSVARLADLLRELRTQSFAPETHTVICIDVGSIGMSVNFN